MSCQVAADETAGACDQNVLHFAEPKSSSVIRIGS